MNVSKRLVFVFISESQMTVEMCAEEDWLNLVPITPAGRDFNSLLFSFQWMPTSATTRDQMKNEGRFLMRIGHKRERTTRMS